MNRKSYIFWRGNNSKEREHGFAIFSASVVLVDVYLYLPKNTGNSSIKIKMSVSERIFTICGAFENNLESTLKKTKHVKVKYCRDCQK